MQPPQPAHHPHSRTLFGETVEDPFHWMRNREDPEVLQHLEAENRYTASVMEPTAALQEQIFQEIKARTQETDIDVPARRGDYFYATRTEEGKDYRIWVRRAGAPDGPEEKVLDENEEASGAAYFKVGNLAVSPDGRLAAYTIDRDGSERYHLRVRDIAQGEDMPDDVPLCSYGLAWSTDSEHVFYTVPDAAMRPWQIWRHRVGSTADSDVLVLEEPDDRFYLSVHRSRSGGFIFIGAESANTSETWAIPAGEPQTEPGSILGRKPGVEYAVDHRGGEFWVVTNDEAPDGSLITIPVAGGQPVTVLSHVPGVKRWFPDCFAGHVVVWGRKDGLPAAEIVPDQGEPHYLEMPEVVYQLAPGKNYEFEAKQLRYRFESPVTPPSVYDHDVVNGERTLLKQTPVLGGYDPGDYVTRREWTPAADGALIPVSLVAHRNCSRDGSAPLIVYAYGAYESSVEAGFSIPRLSVLDRGVVYAIAHVRGGGEMGRDWYEAGKMEHKANTFRDLIDVTEHLLAEGYGDPERVAARGASAGGLTVGAAMAMRPDLYRAVLVRVPFVDVVNTMLDDTLPLTVVEWEEWGNPQVEEEYGWLRSYAPYENVTEAGYPALLATAGLNDPRVSYWEPAKWVAKLREANTGDAPILLQTEMSAGHFARSGRYDTWRDEAFNLGFVLWALGVTEDE